MGEPRSLVGVVRTGSPVDHGPQKPLGPSIVEGGSHRSAVEGRPARIECAPEPAPVVGLVESAQRGGRPSPNRAPVAAANRRIEPA